MLGRTDAKLGNTLHRQINGSKTHLTHHLRRDSAPWRDCIVLPAGRDGTLFRTRVFEQAAERSQLFGPKVAPDPQVVDCAVTMPQPQPELRGVEITLNTHDDAH